MLNYYRREQVNIKHLFTKQAAKEASVSGIKGSIPGAAITALVAGIGGYLGFDLNAESIASLFLGSSLGNIAGQFQKNPKEALLRLKGFFDTVR
jgi:hypothetical protein